MTREEFLDQMTKLCKQYEAGALEVVQAALVFNVLDNIDEDLEDDEYLYDGEQFVRYDPLMEEDGCNGCQGCNDCESMDGCEDCQCGDEPIDRSKLN